MIICLHYFFERDDLMQNIIDVLSSMEPYEQNVEDNYEKYRDYVVTQKYVPDINNQSNLICLANVIQNILKTIQIKLPDADDVKIYCRNNINVLISFIYKEVQFDFSLNKKNEISFRSYSLPLHNHRRGHKLLTKEVDSINSSNFKEIGLFIGPIIKYINYRNEL